MGKKNNGGGSENNPANNGGGGEKKKEESILTVVLKLDLHCEGCATKIKRSITSFQGVEAVKGGDGDLTKLTVIGKVDPAKLREEVEKKVKRKVELISPAPSKKENNNADNKKENQNCNSKKENGNGGQGEEKGDGGGEKKGGGGGEKKPKEVQVTTAVMKLPLHCLGCIKKVRKIVTKTKGYLDMSMDEEKDQITVKGAMDMKALAQSLAEKLKRTVEIVPPKKEKEKENGGGKGKGGGGETGGNGGGQNLYHAQWEYQNPPLIGFEYGYTVYPVYAPQMFSNENPNACSIM